MLPPIDSSVLKNNPQFANLYKGLTELILNDDGSTKLHPQNPVAQERKAVTNELNKHRLAATTEHLLIHALSTTSPDPIPISAEQEFNQDPSLSSGLQPLLIIPPNLKQPLTDLLLLLPSFLSLDFFSSPETPPLDSDSLLLILTSPPLSLLPTLLPYLGPLLSTTLHSQASHLVHLANHLSHPSISTTTTSNPTSTPPLTIPTLPTIISSLTTSTLNLHSSILHSRLNTAEAVRDLLSQYSTAFTLLIKTLEAKHGPIARSLEFKAGETALLAQKVEKESELAVLGVRREVYTPEVKRALRECKEWLVGEQQGLRDKIRRGEEVLGGYGVEVHIEGEGEGEEKRGDAEKEKVMREIARVYGEMEREVDVVRRDLERLGLKGVSDSG